MQLVHEIREGNLKRYRIEIRAADVYCHQFFTMILTQIVLNLRSTDDARAIVENLKRKPGRFHSNKGAHFGNPEPGRVGNCSSGTGADSCIGVFFDFLQHGAGLFRLYQFQSQTDATEARA